MKMAIGAVLIGLTATIPSAFVQGGGTGPRT